eukprot:gene372-403_t
MIGRNSLSRLFQRQFIRRLSDATAKTQPAAAPVKPVVAASAPAAVVTKPSGGSTFFQRLSSFLTGLGVGFGLSGYFIYQELAESNAALQRDIAKLLDQQQ